MGGQSPPGASPAGETARPAARRFDRTASAAEDDLQALVGRALERLLEETACERGAVWWRAPTGEPVVLWACGPALAPDDARLEDALQLAAGADLGAAGAPASLRTLARETGLTAAAPVRGPDSPPLAALLVGGELDPAGAVRPRTLAALSAAADRLAAPFAAARGAARLAALDAHIARLDRLAGLGTLVAEIVHEIRNPLVSVKTFLQLLPERADDREFQGEFHKVATDELRRVERLLDLVLAHGRPQEAARPGAGAAVGEALGAVLQLVAHRAAQADVELDAPEPPPLRTALAEDALRQVLLNLVLNAIEASPRGGAVRVRVRRRREEGEGVEIRVEDDGAGVPSELRQRIFEPFFSTHAERSGGLGLSISRRLAERAGGSLRVVDGDSGCFRLWLPEAQPSSASHSET